MVGSKKAMVVRVVLGGKGLDAGANGGLVVSDVSPGGCNVVDVGRGVVDGDDEQAARTRDPASATIAVVGAHLG
ncbi:MAG TPA: hypothetical protein VG412_00325 [Acidimicrobiales bacterium]|nr:hypothetical protein [Acidimicrobiales bacterium]